MRTAFALGLAALLVAPVARAQTRPPADTNAVALPGLTVTALRERMAIETASLAITLVGPAQLRETRGYGLDDALARIPGVLAQSRYGTSDVRLTIRGFGSRGAGDRSNAGTSRGVRVLTDGFPETEPDGRTAFDLVDPDAVESAEVIRTNASTLWGNAAGGVVSLSTVPSFARGYAEVRGAAGGFGYRKVNLAAGTALGASRVWGSLSTTDFDGWRAHSSGNRLFARVGATAVLGPRDRLSVFALGVRNQFNIPGPLTRAEFDADPRQANATYAARRERRDNRLLRLGATLGHQTNAGGDVEASVYVNPKVLQRSERGTYRDFTRIHVGGALTARQARALSPDVRASVLVGADGQYQDGTILFYSLSPEGTRGTTLRDNKGEGARTAGAFAHAEVAWRERVFATLGARYDDVQYDYRNFVNPRVDDVRTFRHVTPRAGLTVRLAPAASIYAAFGGGVEVPAGNETDPAGTFGQDTVRAINPLLDPVRSNTYELGARGALARAAGPLAAFRYDAALYAIDVRGDLIPYRGGRFYFTAGRTRRLGMEASAGLDVRGGLSLDGALTLSDNTYRSYRVDSVHYGRPGRFADYAGNAVAGTPGAHYGATARFAPAAARGAFVSVSVQGIADYWADDANRVEVFGYTVFNATLGLGRAVRVGRGLSARGFVTVANVADRRYAASAYVNPDVVRGQPVYLEPGTPRALVLSLTLRADR